MGDARGTAQELQGFALEHPRATITPPAALHHASTLSARPEGPTNSFSLWLIDTTANLGSQNNFAPIKTNH
jgi:hypothetical protein